MGKKNSAIDRKTIFKGFRFAIIIGLIFSAILILTTLEVESIMRALNNLSFNNILFLLLLLLLSWLFAGMRFKILVSTIGQNISLKEGILIYLSGSFISYATPFATGGGPFQIYMLHKKGVKYGQASMVIVTQFMLRKIFFLTANIIFLIFFRWAISPGIIPPYVFYMAFGLSFFIAFSIIVFALNPALVEKLLRLLFNINKVKEMVKGSYTLKKHIVKVRREIKEFHKSLELIHQHKIKLLLSLIMTLLFWTSTFMILPFILRGFGYEPHFFRSYVMQTVLNLTLPFMPTPGASGIAEVAFAFLFVSYIPGSVIGLVTFSWRFLTFYVLLIVGGFFAVRELGWKGRELK